MKKTRGFTLIELIAVMVILAILAVVAIPQFVDLRTDARLAAVRGVAGALSSAAMLNYATRTANPGNGSPVDNCNDIGPLLVGGLPLENGVAYTITALAVANGVTEPNCQVLHPSGAPAASFVAVGIL
jgi:MSHA pilin protein MshA